MAITLTVNGVGYAYPATGDQNWADAATGWAQAVTSGMLQKAGGNFTLTANVNFGANFGLISTHFTSRSANPASAGAIRLAYSDAIKFRNATNAGDLALTPASNTVLAFGGVNIVNLSDSQTLTNKTISGASNTITNIDDSSLGSSYLYADGSRSLSANWNAGAHSITANSVVLGNAANSISGINTLVNAGGTLTLPQATDTLVGRATSDTLTNKVLSGNTAVTLISGSGTLTLNTSGTVTLPNATDTLVGKATTDTLTNKTISGASNTLSNIARSSISAGTASHVVINDGSGLLSSEAQLAISRGGTGQATASAGFDALAPTTTRGDLIVRGASANGRLAIGSANQVLKTDGTDPSWGLLTNSNLSGSAAISNANLASMANNTVKGRSEEH